MAFVDHKFRIAYRDFGLKRILANVRQVDAERIRVGVVGSRANEPSGDGRRTVAVAAIINHYGSDDGVVPPRPFLTEPFQKYRSRVARLMRDAAKRVLRPGGTGEQALDWLGGELARIVRVDMLTQPGVPPSNRPKTVEKKGFDHPLVWTNALVRAITHQIVRASGSLLDRGSSAGEYEHFSIRGGG